LLSGYLKPQKRRLVLLFFLLLFSIALQLVNPQIVRFFIDNAQLATPLNTLLFAASMFIGATLLHNGVLIIVTYVSENIGWTATNQLREDVAAHCLKLDMSFHQTYTSGAFIERVDGDVNALTNFFSKLIVSLAGNLLLLAGIVVLLFLEGWVIGTAMLLFVLFAVWAVQYIRKFAVPYWTKMRQISADFYGFLSEHLEGTEDVRANGATPFVLQKFYAITKKWLPIRTKAFLGFASMWIATIIIFALGNALAFALSAYMWNKGTITIGTVYMIFYYTELLVRPIEQIRTQIQDLQRADASIVRIRELLALRPKIADGPGIPVPAGPLSVRFEHVHFSYVQDTPTLRNIHFRLQKGKTLGLLGRTGSGKTTVSRLLLRFYDPDSGNIYLDNVNIRDMTLRELRRHVGLVTQQIELFHGTVRDNLTFYDERIPDSLILDVLHEIGLKAWLESLPDGLDTVLESGGTSLSAGEAQLLAFARVFLADPGVVILDEASSRLDPATEKRIERAMDRLVQNRTCIIIAHRLATIMRADEIMILDNGQIVEYGGRAQLIADRDSIFSRMLRTGMEEVFV